MGHGPRIPERELRFSALRASGPGGQHVNKASTAVQLRFDLSATRALTPLVKARLRALAGQRLNGAGELVLTASARRSQAANRRAALARLQALIVRALIEPKRRVLTAPTPRSRARRLEDKTRRQRLKRLRSSVPWE